MNDLLYKIVAIAIIVLLVVIFFVSYVFNKKTPVPKECEDLLKQNNEHCSSCKNKSCAYYKEEE